MLFIFTDLFQEITNLIVQKPASSQLEKKHKYVIIGLQVSHDISQSKVSSLVPGQRSPCMYSQRYQLKQNSDT